MNRLIACADIHLRDTIPQCRIDDYWKAQEKKFETLISVAVAKDSNIYCSGDLFHKAKSSSYLESWVINKLMKLKKFNLKFFVIPGQHDLPNHNIDLIDHSSINVLHQAEVITLLSTPFEEPFIFEGENIMLIHTMIYKDKPIHKDIKSIKASKLLKENPDVKLIISGDNHQPFTVADEKGRGLVNCGSMMRMSADQVDYRPKFYYIEIEKKNINITDIYYPIQKDVIDRSYIDNEEIKDARIEAFVKHISEADYEIDLNYNKNLESFFKSKKVRKPVQNICWEVLE